MEIRVDETGDGRIKFELLGAGHTFCNNLKKELYADDGIDVAAYKIDHPLVGTPTFMVEKSGRKHFSTHLKDAVDRIQAQNKAFRTAFKKL